MKIVDHLIQKLVSYLEYVPFILMTKDGKIDMNWSRVIEGLIIAGISGAVAGSIALSNLKMEFQYLKESIQRIECATEKRMASLETDTKRIREEFIQYQLNGGRNVHKTEPRNH